MQGSTRVISALPAPVKRSIAEIGRHISGSRKQRGMSQEDMAARMFVARQTLHRLENGDPSVGLSVLAAALFVLGQDRRLRLLAEPDGAGSARRARGSGGDPADLDF